MLEVQRFRFEIINVPFFADCDMMYEVQILLATVTFSLTLPLTAPDSKRRLVRRTLDVDIL